MPRSLWLRVADGGPRAPRRRLLPRRSAAGGQRPGVRCGRRMPIEGSNGTTSPSTPSSSLATRDLAAVNVNTMDEVPGLDLVHESNRPARDVNRGDRPRPETSDALNVDDWPIVQGKSSGITPGYRVDRSRRAVCIRSSSIRPATRRWPAAPRSSARPSITRSATTSSRATSSRSIPRRSSSRRRRRRWT